MMSSSNWGISSQNGCTQPLQRQTELVLAAAANALLATIVDDRVPVAVGLGLVVGVDHERNRLIELELGAAVQAEKVHSEHGELDRQHVARLARRIITGRAV